MECDPVRNGPHHRTRLPENRALLAWGGTFWTSECDSWRGGTAEQPRAYILITSVSVTMLSTSSPGVSTLVPVSTPPALNNGTPNRDGCLS